MLRRERRRTDVWRIGHHVLLVRRGIWVLRRGTSLDLSRTHRMIGIRRRHSVVRRLTWGRSAVTRRILPKLSLESRVASAVTTGIVVILFVHF